MKKLITRTVTGGVYVALIIASLTISSPILFASLFALLLALGLWEFQTLTDSRYSTSTVSKLIDIIGGLLLFFLFYWKTSHPECGFDIFTPYLMYFIIRSIYQLYIKSPHALEAWAFSIMGQLYVALPLSLLNILYTSNPYMLLALFLFIWINDTGAFCVGTLFGKHRLFERISPKKSWEGFWGGLALCVIASILFFHFFNPFFNGPDLSTWISLGVIVSVFSTYGDLCESMIKRSLGVKDSGNILPGHGGILDRIDSLLFVSPIALLFLMAFANL